MPTDSPSLAEVAEIESARHVELEQAEAALRFALRAAESTVTRLNLALTQAEARTAAHLPTVTAAWEAARS